MTTSRTKGAIRPPISARCTENPSHHDYYSILSILFELDSKKTQTTRSQISQSVPPYPTPSCLIPSGPPISPKNIAAPISAALCALVKFSQVCRNRHEEEKIAEQMSNIQFQRKVDKLQTSKYIVFLLWCELGKHGQAKNVDKKYSLLQKSECCGIFWHASMLNENTG